MVPYIINNFLEILTHLSYECTEGKTEAFIFQHQGHLKISRQLSNQKYQKHDKLGNDQVAFLKTEEIFCKWKY